MGYANYQDFSGRYTTRLTEAEVNSHFIPHASARLEERLAKSFTIPFSVNNWTAKDLTMDLAYLLLLQRGKDPREYRSFRDTVETRLAALAAGREAMVTTSGEAIYATPAEDDIWSSTTAYRPVFGMLDADEQSVDPDRLTDEMDS